MREAPGKALSSSRHRRCGSDRRDALSRASDPDFHPAARQPSKHTREDSRRWAMMPRADVDKRRRAAQVRRLVLALLCFGTIGIGVELVALGALRGLSGSSCPCSCSRSRWLSGHRWQSVHRRRGDRPATAASGIHGDVHRQRALPESCCTTRATWNFSVETYPDLAGRDALVKIIHAKVATGVWRRASWHNWDCSGLVYAFPASTRRSATGRDSGEHEELRMNTAKTLVAMLPARRRWLVSFRRRCHRPGRQVARPR